MYTHRHLHTFSVHTHLVLSSHLVIIISPCTYLPSEGGMKPTQMQKTDLILQPKVKMEPGTFELWLYIVELAPVFC